MTVKQLFDQAKSLSAIEKAKLADLILSDLDKPDETIEKQWIKELREKYPIRVNEEVVKSIIK